MPKKELQNNQPFLGHPVNRRINLLSRKKVYMRFFSLVEFLYDKSQQSLKVEKFQKTFSIMPHSKKKTEPKHYSFSLTLVRKF